MSDGERRSGPYQTRVLPLSALHPNTYNPNTMTDEEFAELVEEVRHLGRVPKPVVVRPDGEGFEIVDGEHGWRAAGEAGLAEVTCEVIEADDFEAMRQTYKRNRHGTADPVALGSLFRRMLEARGISQRALAAEIAVSEGTIRNHLLYAEASDMRNSYAFEHLSVRQVRAYLALPAELRDPWLDAGADPDIAARLPAATEYDSDELQDCWAKLLLAQQIQPSDSDEIPEEAAADTVNALAKEANAKIRRLLEEADSLSALVKVHAVVAAWQDYLTERLLRADRKAGEILLELQDQVEAMPKKGSPRQELRKLLRPLQTDKGARRCIRLAQVEEAAFNRYISESKARSGGMSVEELLMKVGRG